MHHVERAANARQPEVSVAEHTQPETRFSANGIERGIECFFITARFLTDPTQFWRVCDANTVMRPGDLEQIARVVRVALPTS